MKRMMNFYEEFNLPEPLGGVTSRITSPKGLRKTEKSGRVLYSLKSDTLGIYTEDIAVEPGLYWVIDVCKPAHKVIWCHYLFIVEKSKSYPVAEYLEQTDTTWVKEAIMLVKAYYKGEKLPKIVLTKMATPVETRKLKSTKNFSLPYKSKGI